MKTKFKIVLFILATIIFISMMLVFGFWYEKQNDASDIAEKPAQAVRIIENSTTEVEEIIKEPELVSLGKFKMTAYCSCTHCCGKWAYNRPVDENGNEIVYGSIGERLIGGVSIAVDPNVIPYNTEVIINGNTYIAHDTGGAIDGNKIDVYMSNHQAALDFGVQYAEVFVVAN